MKKKLALVLTLMMVVTGGIIYAATPNEIITDLTGLSYDEIIAMHSAGMTIGDIAEAYDVFDEFHDAMIEEKEAILDTLVADGEITEEQAETILETMENCDGDRSNQGTLRSFGMGTGMGYGSGNGLKDGSGFGQGNCLNDGSGFGGGYGMGAGNGLRNGSGFGQNNQ